MPYPHLRSAPSRISTPFSACAALVAFTLCSGAALSQTSPPSDAENAARLQRLQEERVNAIRKQQEQSVDVLGNAPMERDASKLPSDEAPCFPITQITLKGDASGDFSWLPEAMAGPQGGDSPVGKCLGAKGINLVLSRLQNELIARGYITTRVVAEAQDLKSGVLVFELAPGRIHSVRLADDSQGQTSLFTAMPSRAGELLNLRAIEHGLENLKGIPSADANVRIVPADQPGQSDLLVTYRQSNPLRGTLTLDDNGSKSTGKYQGGATLSWDNPAGLSDLLYFSANHHIGSVGRSGTNGAVVHYAVPLGFWSASATYDQSRFKQAVVGAFQDYVYSGRNANAELKISRLVQRDATSKTTAGVGIFQRSARNFIDDTEVEVQRRRTGGWLATLNHRHNFEQTTLDATVGFRQGTGNFGSMPAPEEAFGEGTSRFKIVTLDVALAGPVSLLGQNLRYSINARAQRGMTPLSPPERFSIGGRNTVRGFDGDAVLSADNGWLLRNELSKLLMAGRLEAYVGIDLGQVSGQSAALLAGKHLAGAVVGLRSSAYGVRYGFFVGAPISKPDRLATSRVAAGFNLSYSF